MFPTSLPPPSPSAENFAEYLDALESTAMWGGEMELRALSNEFTRPIEVALGSMLFLWFEQCTQNHKNVNL